MQLVIAGTLHAHDGQFHTMLNTLEIFRKQGMVVFQQGGGDVAFCEG